jgi:hypothetical protein
MGSQLTLLGAGNAGSVAPFDPTLYGTVYGDFNPSVSSMWQDQGRSTPATADGQTVDSIQYAVSKYASIASGGPTLKLSRLNGYASLLFSGAQQLSDGTWSIGGSQSVFLVAKATAAGNGFAMDATNTSPNRVAMFISGTPAWRSYAASSSTESLLDPLGDWVIVSLINDTVGGGLLSRVSGLPNNKTGEGNSFSGINLGVAQTGASFFTGEIARLIAYNGKLNSTNETSVLSGLATMYNLPVFRCATLDAADTTLVVAMTEMTVGGTPSTPYIELDGGFDNKCYQQFASLDTHSLRSRVTVAIQVNNGANSHAPYTAAESQHVGLAIYFTDQNNFYILMISSAASGTERSVQLTKRVASVETIIASSQANVTTITTGTQYVLDLVVTAGNVVGTVYAADGVTQLVQLSAATDAGLTTGNTCLHVFATKARFYQPLTAQ